ncbi:Protein CBG26335 [Caenorhabditis briggsae]|uniref:Protein CBG26335 n=1 Tax=Caenorhabditis briggsae TaxID=6238 RepID=B6IGA7_CAEBR|nr:Protein CBG26335 [Caenorhabditis briggsae]CAR98937.1 Protein CBG26335 [Caenorhabditis briggsae]
MLILVDFKKMSETKKISDMDDTKQQKRRQRKRYPK